jgi:hypothetical protein
MVFGRAGRAGAADGTGRFRRAGSGTRRTSPAGRPVLSNKITKKLLLKIFNLETEMEKIEVEIRNFTFGFAKG